MEYAKVDKRISQEEERPTDEYNDALEENNTVAKVSQCNILTDQLLICLLLNLICIDLGIHNRILMYGILNY